MLSIRDSLSWGINPQPIQNVANDVSRGIRYHLSMGKTRFLFPIPVSIDRHGDLNRHFPLAPTVPFPFPRLRPKERFVQLYEPCQTTLRVSLSHRLLYLMRHHPDPLVISNTKFSSHLCYGYPGLGCRHSIDKPKPLSERNLHPMKNSPCGHRCLILTGLTLCRPLRFASNNHHDGIWDTETPPASVPYEQIFQTFLVRIKLILKLKQRHCVTCHLFFL